MSELAGFNGISCIVGLTEALGVCVCDYITTEGHMLFSSVSQRPFNEASVCVLSRSLEHETPKHRLQGA